jgi:O-antigen ligase
MQIDPIRIRYLSIPYLVGALLAIPMALSILRDRTIWVLRVPQVKILLALAFLYVISALWSDFNNPIVLFPELDQTERIMQIFFSRLVFLILFLYFITSPETIELSAWVVLGLIVACAMTALFSFLAGGGVGRARATFGLAGNPNFLATICLFATSLLWFYRSHGSSRRLKVVTLPLLFLVPLTALSTGSRNGWLQMVVLAFFILKEQQGWSVARRARSFLLLGALVILLFVVLPAAQFMRATTFDPAAQAPGKESLTERLNTLSALVQMGASNPILGVGIGNFRWVHQAYYGEDRSPHNSYLRTLAEGGVVALALYLILFYLTHRMLRHLQRWGPPQFLWLSKGLKVNLVLFLVFSLFADYWTSDFLYLIIGLTVAMTCLWQSQNQGLAPIPNTLAASKPS